MKSICRLYKGLRLYHDLKNTCPSLRLGVRRHNHAIQDKPIVPISIDGTATFDRLPRLSSFWAPTGGITPIDGQHEDSHSFLIRAGLIRQTHAGIFHFLPLGLRVQEKLERLLDYHMRELGASKLSLSSITSESLWKKTGRLQSNSSELFRIESRHGGKLLLSPTHEEEITTLVADAVKSYRDLPLRLYQISRKYRSEKRPRGGLLRSQEFLMKDLYTFDISLESALETYKLACNAYRSVFASMKLPILMAEASPGNIGGDLSHEYHLPSPSGEDTVINCINCNYVANEERAESRITVENRGLGSTGGCSTRCTKEQLAKMLSEAVHKGEADGQLHGVVRDSQNPRMVTDWLGITQDRSTIIQAFMPCTLIDQTSDQAPPRQTEVNLFTIKELCPDVDLSVEDALLAWRHHRATSPGDSRVSPKLIQIIDVRLRREDINSWTVSSSLPGHLRESSVAGDNSLYEKEIPPEEVYEADLIRIKSDDPCPRCLQGKLYVQRAIELGHTFHLGTKYSEPLNAKVEYGEVQPSHKIVHVPQQALMKRVALQMGCHGIGVSRIIGAVAHTLADKKGLNWPRIIAPFEVVIVPTRGQEAGLEEVCNLLICGHIADGKVGNIDAVVDDREKGFAWKLKDADMIGYPVIIVIGRDWENGRECEVQCRRLAYREVVEAEMLPSIVNHLLTQL